jgi:hypothetical protein
MFFDVIFIVIVLMIVVVFKGSDYDKDTVELEEKKSFIIEIEILFEINLAKN